MIRFIFRRLAACLLIVISIATLPACGTAGRVGELPSAAVARGPVNADHGPGRVIGLAEEEDVAASAIE